MALAVDGAAAASGTAAFRRGDYADAVATFTRKAERGDRVAQNNLGVMYLKGHGVALDHARARTLFSAAAAQGLPGAMFNLGIMYLRGYGMAPDAARAADWFEQAAAAGDTEAHFFLGLQYYKGEGVAVDLVRARTLFATAAAGGLAPAQYNLAMLQLQAGEEGAAQVWLESAADKGHPGARLALARLDLAHDEDPARMARAAATLGELAHGGDAEAQMQFGLLNVFGRGVAADPEEGRFWLRQSALQGHIPAQINLGAIYAQGIGTTADPVQAYAWLKLAADDDVQARRALDDLATKLATTEKAGAETLAAELAAKIKVP